MDLPSFKFPGPLMGIRDNGSCGIKAQAVRSGRHRFKLKRSGWRAGRRGCQAVEWVYYVVVPVHMKSLPLAVTLRFQVVVL